MPNKLEQLSAEEKSPKKDFMDSVEEHARDFYKGVNTGTIEAFRSTAVLPYEFWQKKFKGESWNQAATGGELSQDMEKFVESPEWKPEHLSGQVAEIVAETIPFLLVEFPLASKAAQLSTRALNARWAELLMKSGKFQKLVQYAESGAKNSGKVKVLVQHLSSVPEQLMAWGLTGMKEGPEGMVKQALMGQFFGMGETAIHGEKIATKLAGRSLMGALPSLSIDLMQNGKITKEGGREALKQAIVFDILPLMSLGKKREALERAVKMGMHEKEATRVIDLLESQRGKGELTPGELANLASLRAEQVQERQAQFIREGEGVLKETIETQSDLHLPNKEAARVTRETGTLKKLEEVRIKMEAAGREATDQLIFFHGSQWKKYGFSAEKHLKGVRGPLIEVAGPTQKGYEMVDLKRLDKRMLVSNFEMPKSYDTKTGKLLGSEKKGVDFLADAASLPLQEGSAGALFISALGPTVESKTRGAQTADLRQRSMLEAIRVLEDNGLLVWQGGSREDIDFARSLGFEMVQYKNNYPNDPKGVGNWELIFRKASSQERMDATVPMDKFPGDGSLPVEAAFFDPKSEFAKVKKMKSGERRREYPRFKRELIDQRIGLAEIKSALIELIKEKPNQRAEEYIMDILPLEKKYKLSPEQRTNISRALHAYEYSHQAIQENAAACKNWLTRRVNGAKLYEKLFGRKPKGKIKVEIESAMIYFKTENIEDYAHAYGYNGESVLNKELSPEIIKNAENTGGFMLPEYAGDSRLNGVIAFQKGIDVSDGAQTMNHERQHVFNSIFRRGYDAESKEYRAEEKRMEEVNGPQYRETAGQYLDALKRETAIKSSIKDEISASFTERGLSPSEIRARYLQPETIYSYGLGYEPVMKKGTKFDSGFNKEYLSLVEDGIVAYDILMKNGYSAKDVQAILYEEKLDSWPQVAERITGQKRGEWYREGIRRAQSFAELERAIGQIPFMRNPVLEGQNQDAVYSVNDILIRINATVESAKKKGHYGNIKTDGGGVGFMEYAEPYGIRDKVAELLEREGIHKIKTNE